MPKIVISVGQFIHRKGFDVLLRAWKNCSSDAMLYIIGGEPTDEYTRLINQLNLTNVYFVGFKSKKELKEYYKAADLFVLPTREDIWGLVVNEAMAAGLPVITTDRCVAGLELIQNDFNGYIVPAGNEKALADKINNVLQDDKTIGEYSQNSIQAIAKYTIHNMAESHIHSLRSIRGK